MNKYDKEINKVVKQVLNESKTYSFYRQRKAYRKTFKRLNFNYGDYKEFKRYMRGF